MSKVALILLGVSVVLLAILVFFIKLNSEKKKQISKLKQELDNRNKQIQILKNYLVSNNLIKTSKEKKDKELSEAETDEEVVDIINSIINGNNNRVREQQ